MAPTIKSAKLTLSYPLYGCDFDPENVDRLIVGGGGGAGRSGVGNKITVLDTSNPRVFHQETEIDLSKDEDNVTSLAVGTKRGKDTLLYAGINSSHSSVAKGKNEHFRAFRLEPQSEEEKAAVTRISELSKTKLFSVDHKDVYQRVLRLSRPYPNFDQVGVIASGLAPNKSEVVVFDTVSTKSTGPSLRGRIELQQEAADIDIIQNGKDDYRVVYCTNHEILLKAVSAKTNTEDPVSLHAALTADRNGSVPIVTFRSVRFMTSEFLLVLANLPGASGCRLLVYRIYEKDGQLSARVAQTRQLPSKIKQGTGLAVANLSPLKSPGEKQGYSQFIAAVTAKDSSISLFVIDHQVSTTISLMMQPKPLLVLKQVHPLGITGLTFSSFIPPTSDDDGMPEPTLKLASVSAANTLVVHTIPLKLKDKSSGRYITAIAPKDESSIFTPALLLSLLTVLVISIVVQGILEIQGTTKPYLGAKEFLSHWDGDKYAFLTSNQPFKRSRYDPVKMAGKNSLVEKAEKLSQESADGQVIVIQDSADANGGLKAVAHDEAKMVEKGAKTWEELPPEQKESWKKKLVDAGHWVEGLGETVLKGVLFGEMGAQVGHAVAG